MSPKPRSQVWIICGSIGAALGVAFGAFGAHALESRLSLEALNTFETAVRYQMYHSFALLLTGLTTKRISKRYINTAGWLFSIGIFLFSGSLYVYVGSEITAFAMITPVGGLAFLGGWVSIIIGSIQYTRKGDIDN